ncbi:hypothetical protein [Methanoregula sp.]|uniref:hypothetical protein n=1 Tax=Methanoregula sp. TaxID=2052170 RepID=UPI003BB03D91
MPEPTTNNKKPVAARRGCIDEHTCACGEKHEEPKGEISHREACTSPLKFGETCCCQSEEDAQTPHRCGHGPRCH